MLEASPSFHFSGTFGQALSTSNCGIGAAPYAALVWPVTARNNISPSSLTILALSLSALRRYDGRLSIVVADYTTPGRRWAQSAIDLRSQKSCELRFDACRLIEPR